MIQTDFVMCVESERVLHFLYKRVESSDNVSLFDCPVILADPHFNNIANCVRIFSNSIPPNAFLMIIRFYKISKCSPEVILLADI